MGRTPLRVNAAGIPIVSVGIRWEDVHSVVYPVRVSETAWHYQPLYLALTDTDYDMLGTEVSRRFMEWITGEKHLELDPEGPRPIVKSTAQSCTGFPSRRVPTSPMAVAAMKSWLCIVSTPT